MKCAACGTELAEGALLCPKCGRAVQTVQMKCVGCGAEVPEGALVCPQCGRVVEIADVVKQQAGFKTLTRKEFYQLPGMKSCRNNIKSCAIVLYLCAAITAVAAVLWDAISVLAILDALALLLLGLWLQFGKSRIAALLVTVYGFYSVIVTAMETGEIRGWWIPLAGIWAVTYTFRFYKLWNKYKKSGVLPDDALSA